MRNPVVRLQADRLAETAFRLRVPALLVIGCAEVVVRLGKRVVDAQGARIFDDADIPAIQALDGTGFARILEVAKRLSLSDPEVIAARKKRFASVRPSTSSAGSPSG